MPLTAKGWLKIPPMGQIPEDVEIPVCYPVIPCHSSTPASSQATQLLAQSTLTSGMGRESEQSGKTWVEIKAL